MKFNDVPKFISDIYKLGNWRLIVALFGCISAFTIGAVVELGINFLPIIDKAHMISVMGFYLISFYILFVIVSFIWRYLFIPTNEEDGRPLNKIFFLDIIIFLVVFGVMIKLFVLFKDISDSSYSSRNLSFVLVSLKNALSMGIRNTLLSVSIALFLFILALRRFLKFLIPKLYGELSDLVYRRVSNQLSLFLVALLMMIFLESGSVWMRIAYFQPSSMVVSYVETDQPDVRVTIVMRAQNGFIGIADGNRFPEYFGWNSIRRITPSNRK